MAGLLAGVAEHRSHSWTEICAGMDAGMEAGVADCTWAGADWLEGAREGRSGWIIGRSGGNR